jgi:hypothetical protein
VLSFKNFLQEQKLRQGLEHLSKLSHERLGDLLKGDSLQGTTTPKTDGAAGEVGYDEHGFYTRSARSDKVRNSGEYSAYTRNKRGEDADTSVSSQYDAMHHKLQNNPKLVSYLKSRHEDGKPSAIKGEFFLKGLGEKTDKGIKFVGTSYNPKAMGNTGMFIVHHKLPENSTHNPNHISSLGDSHVTFDHDKSEGNKFNIDTSVERKLHGEINPELLKSRKSADKDAKEAEHSKLNVIRNSLENKLKTHLKSMGSRPWEVSGESEGNVFHPKGNSPFKIQSDSFKSFKADQKK